MVVLCLAPHHFYFYYDPQLSFFLCRFSSSVNRGGVRLWTFVHAIFFVSLPSMIVCASSFILVHNRCKRAGTLRGQRSVTARRMQRSSVLIAIVSVWILVSVVPTGILRIFMFHDRFFYRDTPCSTRWIVYKILLNSFLVLSSMTYSIKFYIHLMISTPFRRSFIHLVTCTSMAKNSSDF